MDEAGFGVFGTGRGADGRFGLGNPGRPRGSRNRRTHQLTMALLEDFHSNEEENLQRMRQWFFSDYLRLIGRFLPAHVPQARPDFADYGAEETALVVAAARTVLARIERGEAGLDELLGVLEADPAKLTDISNSP
jgi:hypothetical protein